MFDLNSGGLFGMWFPNAFSQDAAWTDGQTAIFWCMIGIIAVAAYMLGSINSAIIISRVLYHDDIRKHGSGNAGMTNMQRTYGNGAAGLTLLGDLLKTVFAVSIAGVCFGFGYISGLSTNGYCYVAGLIAVIGHVFPLYYGFKGGKGVLSTATMALVLTPWLFLILFALFVAIVAMSKYISLGSVSVAVLYPVVVSGAFTVVFGMPLSIEIALSTILLAVLIVVCHMGNLKRISDRTERKFSFKKKKAEPVVAEEEDGDEE